MTYILLLLFSMSVFLSFIKNKRKIFGVLFFLFGMVLVVVATFRSPIMPDYSNYVFAYWNGETKFEPTFDLISSLTKLIYDTPLMMFFIYAVLGVGIKMYAIKKISPFIWLSVATYISYIFILHDMIQIRVGVASGMLLLSIEPLTTRNWKRFLLYVIIAVCFHYSALIMLPLWFLNSRKPYKMFYMAMLLISYPLALNGFTIGRFVELIPFAPIQRTLDMYHFAQEEGFVEHVNIFGFMQLLMCLMSVFFLCYISKIEQYNKCVVILVKIFTISNMALVLLSDIPVLAIRTKELLSSVSILLYPMVVYAFKQIQLAKLIPIIIGLTMLLLNIFYNDLGLL